MLEYFPTNTMIRLSLKSIHIWKSFSEIKNKGVVLQAPRRSHTTLAAGSTSNHVQVGGTDVQDPDHIDPSILQSSQQAIVLRFGGCSLWHCNVMVWVLDGGKSECLLAPRRQRAEVRRTPPIDRIKSVV